LDLVAGFFALTFAVYPLVALAATALHNSLSKFALKKSGEAARTIIGAQV
jgi:uncharacterized protein (DUF1778 family)